MKPPPFFLNHGPIDNIAFGHIKEILRRVLFGFFASFGVVYLMFQKKLFNKGATRIISKLLFYPTLPITLLLRYGNIFTAIDDTIYLGCAPVACLGHPNRLRQELDVRGVVNMCYEYEGPVVSIYFN